MSTDTLREEHESLQRGVRDSRREALAAPETAFVREMQGVMDDYSAARKAGTPRDIAIQGIEAVLRSAWPQKPSKFGPVCDSCDDTGWTEHTCTDRVRCERKQCQEGHPGREHTYVVACHCPRGDGPGGRTRAKQLDEISEAMQIRKPAKKRGGFSRMGQ